MPELPVGIETVTLTGRFLRPDGTPLLGTITLTSPARLTFPDADVISAGPVEITLDEFGAFSVSLIATDQPEMDPTGWTYQVVERFSHAEGRSYSIALPAASPVVDLADIAPADPANGDFVLVPGPAGPAGSQIFSGTGAPSSSLGTDGDYYVDTTTGAVKLYGPKASGAWPSTGVALGSGNLVASVNSKTGAVELSAADVGADAAGAASTAVSTHAGATDPHGDRAWATGQFLDKTAGGTVAGALNVSGTVTATGLVLPAGSVTSNKAAVFPSPTGAVSYVIWRAPKACTVVAVRGFRSGGTGATVNASKNGSADLLSVDLSLSTDVTWLSGASVQNASMAAGDYLALKVTGVTGTPSYVTVQVDVQAA
ncbi:hypothetical protein [Streptomyces sp. NPDC058272]|uniref:hypothetical protein n=1 Tax=Streptomyces sp. NPDC058272 TaxID=3346415 RepID=UPI0036EAED9F